MERVLRPSSARKLDQILETMVLAPMRDTDPDVLVRCRLDPTKSSERYYCHLLQVQTTISDLSTLIMRASQFYTCTIYAPQSVVDIFAGQLKVNRIFLF